MLSLALFTIILNRHDALFKKVASSHVTPHRMLIYIVNSQKVENVTFSKYVTRSIAGFASLTNSPKLGQHFQCPSSSTNTPIITRLCHF
jgi:hypothetical protein